MIFEDKPEILTLNGNVMKLFTYPILFAGILLNATAARSGPISVKESHKSVSAHVAETLKKDVPKDLYFIENIGQITDIDGYCRPDIDYKLESDGVSLMVGDGAIRYHWKKYDADNLDWTFYRLDVKLIGARASMAVPSEQNIYTERHFLPAVGGDGLVAHSWKKVTYPGVYPNIDWVIYIKGDKVEYDFVVHPGGKVSDIRIQYDGVDQIKINKDGSLTAITPLGTVTEKAPYSFQQDGKTVASAFQLDGNILSFQTGAYQGILTIDPELDWSTMYGGPGIDFIFATACDQEGNVYITGQTSSTSNMTTVGSHWATRQTTIGNTSFLVKFDSTGQREWGTYYGDGATSSTYGRALACDPWGNVYLFGQTALNHSTNTISTPGSHQDTISMNAAGTSTSNDAFLVKFNSAGVRIWGTYYGGSSTEDGRGVACDKFGNVYVCGITNSPTTFKLATPGAHQQSFGSTGTQNDGFIAKFDSSGVRLWGSYYGGDLVDQFYGIAADPSGEYVYAVGSSTSTNAMATAGTHRSDFISGSTASDAILVKFDSSGQRVWGTYYGGTLTDGGSAIAVDPAGKIYICGQTLSTDSISTPGAHQPALDNSLDGYLAKFNEDGQLVWGTYYGGNGGEQANALYADPFGNVFMCGATSAPTGIATPGAFQDTVSTSQDIYLAQFDSAGALKWATYMGGKNTEIGYATTGDGLGHVFMAGVTLGATTQYYTTPGAHQSVYGGGSHDGVLTRWSYCPELAMPATVFGPDTLCFKLGDTLEYFVDKIPGATAYEWTLPQGWTGSSDSNRIIVQPGTTGGLIEVRALNVCDSGDVQSMSIYIRPGDVISINASGFTLSISGSYSSYQWYSQDGIIDGATGSSFEVDENGVYYVVVVDANGCIHTSLPYEVTNVGVNNIDRASTIKIYPNPTNGKVHITTDQAVYVQLHGVDGRKFMEQTITDGWLDISNLPEGMYLLSIIDLNGELLKLEKLIRSDK